MTTADPGPDSDVEAYPEDPMALTEQMAAATSSLRAQLGSAIGAPADPPPDAR
jgi:hypothetical protein